MDANNHPQEQKEQTKASPVPKAKGLSLNSRRIFSKRWVYPAIYLGAAAIIIGLMYLKSQAGSSPVTSNAVDEGVTQGQTATTTTETFAWPVAASAQPKVTVGFFSSKATQQEQAAALIYYDNGYYPHQGYDIQAANKSTFNVQAALSGKVTAVMTGSKKDPLMGNVIEITSPNGYVTKYESLGSVNVKVGDTVRQGQVIGTSGTSVMEQSQGNHLYFEIDKNGAPVDPGTVLPKL
ncbi:MAG: M23 family metallopeptidase [Alicyclobacillus sp.]|nr:M23 family metallopeptidase [Alicyclobacillus sp.]